jgi:hypothetical protein
LSLRAVIGVLRLKENALVCADCDRLFRDLIAAHETFDELLIRLSEAAQGKDGEYRSVRAHADAAEAELNRARDRFLEHRKEHGW